MIGTKKLLLAAAGSAACVLGGAAHATEVKVNTVQVAWIGPTSTTEIQICPGQFTVGAGIECTYSDAANTLTFDFTDGQLIVDQYISDGYRSLPWAVAVTQSREYFQYSSISLASSDFPFTIPSAGLGGLTSALHQTINENRSVNTDITLTFGGIPDGGHHYHAVFDLTVAQYVPEPASYALMLAGLGLLLRTSAWRRRSAGSGASLRS